MSSWLTQLIFLFESCQAAKLVHVTKHIRKNLTDKNGGGSAPTLTDHSPDDRTGIFSPTNQTFGLENKSF